MENWIDEYGVEYSADKTELIRCPRIISSYKIKEGTRVIRDSAFYYYTSFFYEYPCEIESITIPNSVTLIGDSAFASCYKLTAITIPDSVISIGKNVFSDCDNLTSITIPDSVTSIGDGAFSYCESLTSIEIDGNNFIFEDGVLFNRKKTKIIICLCSNNRPCYTIPDSVISIGERTFVMCKSLMSITIPDSVTSIGEGAFTRCESLTSIIIPKGDTRLRLLLEEEGLGSKIVER